MPSLSITGRNPTRYVFYPLPTIFSSRKYRCGHSRFLRGATVKRQVSSSRTFYKPFRYPVQFIGLPGTPPESACFCHKHKRWDFPQRRRRPHPRRQGVFLPVPSFTSRKKTPSVLWSLRRLPCGGQRWWYQLFPKDGSHAEQVGLLPMPLTSTALKFFKRW